MLPFQTIHILCNMLLHLKSVYYIYIDPKEYIPIFIYCIRSHNEQKQNPILCAKILKENSSCLMKNKSTSKWGRRRVSFIRIEILTQNGNAEKCLYAAFATSTARICSKLHNSQACTSTIHNTQQNRMYTMLILIWMCNKWVLYTHARSHANWNNERDGKVALLSNEMSTHFSAISWKRIQIGKKQTRRSPQAEAPIHAYRAHVWTLTQQQQQP